MLLHETGQISHNRAGGLRHVLLIILVGLVLVACKSDAKLNPLPADGKILAFGDSLTYGTGALPEHSYPVVLQSLIDREVVNGGVPGEISAEGLKRLAIWLKEYEPKLVIICHGANDLLRALSEEKAAENVRAMVKLARDQGVDVLLVAVPKFGLMRTPPEFYEEIAHKFDVPIERHVLKDIEGNEALKSDAVHPNAEGYRLMAQAIAKRLQKSGAL